jgi:hypothetical protein
VNDVTDPLVVLYDTEIKLKMSLGEWTDLVAALQDGAAHGALMALREKVDAIDKHGEAGSGIHARVMATIDVEIGRYEKRGSNETGQQKQSQG